MKIRIVNTSFTRFTVFLIVVVMVNLAGLTLFVRYDLTASKAYSLSPASREVVGSLAEPLTLHIFFSRNLPAPHNGTERYLRDLVEEYALYGGVRFNYTFHDVSAEEGNVSEEAGRNQRLAEDYGIHPVQVQNIEQDQVKFQKAYMGMALIHGDVVETLPAITSTDGLEYTLTSTLRRMKDKISALNSLTAPIQVRLYLSSSLDAIAPLTELKGLGDGPAAVRKAVDALNARYYGKLVFSRLDPAADPRAAGDVERYRILRLNWPALLDPAGREIPAGSGAAGILVLKGDKVESVPLIEEVRHPLFGTQYRLADLSGIGDRLGEAVENLLNVNKKIGYLSDHGTPRLAELPPFMARQAKPPEESLSNFRSLVEQSYAVEAVNLADGGIPEGIDCLVIAGPREEFSDYALFQIDQFLMKGKSLAVFLDAFMEVSPQGNGAGFNQFPMHVPLNTGLEKLLEHYGAAVRKSFVLDENCYEQRIPEMYGGGKRPLYFAPLVRGEFIRQDLPYLKNIKGLVVLTVSPVDARPDTLKRNGIACTTLFSSSGRSWEMKDRIDLNPLTLTPPGAGTPRRSEPLALLLEGEFPSYFAGKPVPSKPAGKREVPGDAVETGSPGEGEKDAFVPAAGKAGTKTGVPPSPAAGLRSTGGVLVRGKPGRIFLTGSSAILGNNLLDAEGESPNATLVMNLLDHLNDRDAYATLRSKTQLYNPLREHSPETRTLVKTVNIVGLPVLAVLFGILVHVRRSFRKKAIQAKFRK